MQILRIFVVFLALGPLTALGATEIFVDDLQTRLDVFVRLLVVKPERPRAIAVLFAGARGLVTINDDGTTSNRNFLVRSREIFARHGVVAVVVGPPSDRLFAAPDGSGTIGLGFGFRRTREHAEDIAAIINRVRALVPGLPVWLVGTSRGSTSAAYGAMRLLDPAGAQPDGVVLTSSLAVPVPPETEPADNDSLLRVGIAPGSFGLSLSQIKVPVLVMHHVNDQCFVTPYAGVAPLLQQLTGSGSVEGLAIRGGSTPMGDPCQALHYHGFIGIEGAVVARLAHWIKVTASGKP